MNKVVAIVEKDKCHPDKCNLECIKYDPLNRSGGEGFHIGPSGKSEIAKEVVTDMHRISAKMCPFQAIKIANLPKELNSEPLHMYGQNGFHLFFVPIPNFGKITGILGRNGIGKTTSIKILAGLITPNLGRNEEATYEEIVKFFRGSEAQNYFEKLKDKKITIAYKPQRIDDIPKQYSGKVIDLLKKIDEMGILNSVTKELNLKNILNNDLKNLSGGELQRIAIAATVMKKANVLYFDEPSSYLDIKERIRIANYIKSLVNEETAIIVIEHDLLILDFITDVIHLMYGEPVVYGIASKPLASKTGINSYLDGYLRTENIQFRQNKIHFGEKAIKIVGKQLIASWPEMKKKLGNFNLDAKPGSIHNNEIVGILGGNATGKTSFVKMLANVIKPDNCSIDLKLKVSYKPQYLEADSDDLVETVLAKLEHEVDDYRNQILKHLDLEGLLLKKLNELSGGELQRVAIALCLLKKADLYLLDEPCAYLDVEQRLNVSKAIKEAVELRGASAFVVDHDLLFLDYISDSLLVFEGEPSVNGKCSGPYNIKDGMNKLLKDLNITIRRDEDNKRPRINKPDSLKDREQKTKGEYFAS